MKCIYQFNTYKSIYYLRIIRVSHPFTYSASIHQIHSIEVPFQFICTYSVNQRNSIIVSYPLICTQINIRNNVNTSVMLNYVHIYPIHAINNKVDLNKILDMISDISNNTLMLVID